MLNRLSRLSIAALPALVLATAAEAQVSLTMLGSAYTQNFDSLAQAGTNIAWTDNTTIVGWYATRTTYNAGTGSSNTGAMYSFGVLGANPVTDRALGGVGSGGTGTFYWAARFVNNTGSTITSLDVSYMGEQWRDGGAAVPAAQTMAFQYQVANAGVITDADTPATGWTAVSPLNFTSPIFVNTATGAALEGNLAANRTARVATISSLSVAPGQEIWIRWQDQNDAGNDHGLAIDDLSVTPQGGVGVQLSINDVTQVETNVGTTTFTFTVSLSAPAPAGGVTFDITTADNTALLSDNDYVLNSMTAQTIAAGNTTYPFNVTVNGDTNPETNETFFVNVSNVTGTGVTVADGMGLGTITNDDIAITKIHDIQGPGATSPLSGSVTTRGIVTALKSNGFFIQEPDAGIDANPNTSEGIFVFTSVAPPAQAVLGNDLTLTATISEFVPSADPGQPPLTELTSPGSYVVNSSGNPLPAATTITSAMTLVNSIENLEFLEGMRVTVPSLTAIAPTQGNKSEPNATSTTNGVFYAVVTGVARPFREAGIQANDPAPSPATICPTGAPNCVPRFDFNPERLRVDSDSQTGSTALDVNTGATITGMVGVLDYAFRTYTILPDPTPVASVAGGIAATPSAAPTNQEFTVASMNLERFYDTVDDAGSDVVLTATAYNNRLAKASLAIRNYLNFPDVIGVEEMEHLAALTALANKINADAVAAMQPNPNYQPFLIEGNDVGGIDVGFLVKTGAANVAPICGGSAIYTGARITGITVNQFNLTETWTDPCSGSPTALLNDRPPLVFKGTVHHCNGTTIDVAVIVNHLRSLNGIDDETTVGCMSGTNGNRVRMKRRLQAESLANLIQARQTTDPLEKIIVLGDFNAFEVSDGYVDSMGTIAGTPTPAGQVVQASADLVNPNLIPLDSTPVPAERYSYSFDGSAQSLDHILINGALASALTSYRIEHPRIDADFAEAPNRGNAGSPSRISDHDPVVGYFNFLPSFPVTLTNFVAE